MQNNNQEEDRDAKLKKIADELLKVKGRTKGSETLSLARYLESKYDKEAVKKVEQKMKELGYPLYFDKIKPARWYSEAHNNLAMIVAKELFGWKDLFELGYNSPVFSFGVKVFVKLTSVKKVIEGAAKTWRKFVDVGTLEAHEFNEKEKYIALRHKDYKFHPLMCTYMAGFLLRLAEYTIKSDKITVEETKCAYKGGPYHEYVIKWE